MKTPPVLHFLVFCVATFSEAIHATRDVGFNVLYRHGILDYLAASYDSLHTQGKLYILTDIVELLIARGYFPQGSSPLDIIPEYAQIGA